MKRSIIQVRQQAGKFAVVALTSLLLFACASSPSGPAGSAEVRSKLTALQNDPNLAERARVEIQEAEEAVKIAEQAVNSRETALGEHRVYMADRKVEIARAKATTRFAEHQRAGFAQEREAARLEARTREADRARRDADFARADAGRARDDAGRARSAAEIARLAEAESAAEARRARDEAEAARLAEAGSAADVRRARDDASQARSEAETARSSEAASAAEAARKAAELQRRVDALEARPTERGLVLTLGDVLFATGSSDLLAGADNRLNRLVSFLDQYPERNVLIEGHTDNVGNADYNQGLSQRRADAVRSYLTRQGVDSQRLSAAGMGLHQPVSSNDSATGRQQNRRVEIIIEDAK